MKRTLRWRYHQADSDIHLYLLACSQFTDSKEIYCIWS